MFKTYGERAPILFDFYNHVIPNFDSVTIFRQIDSVKHLARQEKDDDLALEAELMRVHYFYFRPNIFPRDLIVRMIDSLKQKSIQKKIVWLEAISENMLALYNFSCQEYEQGFVHHQRVYRLIKDISPDIFPHKQNCLVQMAIEHYRFNDFPETIFYTQEALKAQPKQRMSERPPRMTLLNTLGLVYQKKGQLDSADYYFNQIISEATVNKDRVWLYIASGNLGNSYFLRGWYDKAIPLLKLDVMYAVLQKDWGLASGSQMILGAISLERKDLASASRQLALARSFVDQSNQYNRKEKLYLLLAKLSLWKGLQEEANMYFDSALVVKDSIARAFNSLQLLRARQKAQLEQYNAEMENISNRRKINLMERNILMGFVLLLMIASILIYKTLLRKNRLQREKAARANEELTNATKQLSIFARNISEKNALIEMLQERQGQDHSTVLEELQKSTILTDEDWDYFRNLFEKVHSGFLQRLKEKVPGLTPAETRFMVLTRLGMSGKEMAGALGIGTDAIRQLRSRVRKKLQLPEETNIEIFTSGI